MQDINIHERQKHTYAMCYKYELNAQLVLYEEYIVYMCRSLNRF